MNHNDIRHRLSEYIDGSLTSEERASVDEHIRTCEECSMALQELRKTIEHVKNLEEIDPPAWMTGKIMAEVRADRDKKRTTFERLFFPLHIKLPLEALGVLVIAVAAAVLYRDVQPLTGLPEPPAAENFSRLEQQPAQQERNKSENPAAAPSPRVPQSPEYKALDMKRAYEAPSPPVPERRQDAASASADSEPMTGRFSDAPAAAPDTTRENAPEAAGSSAHLRRDSERAAKQKQSLAFGERSMQDDLSPDVFIRLEITTVSGALRRIEEAVVQQGGTVQKKENRENGFKLSVTVAGRNKESLFEKLKKIGRVTELRDFDQGEGYLTLEITAVQAAPALP